MQITIELAITETLLAASSFGKADRTQTELLLRTATYVPVLLNVCCLVESYWHNNLKLVPLMLQFIMIRKELSLLFPIEDGENSQMRNMLKTLGIIILVFMQVVTGTFTSQPYWFRRINPFIHFTIIYTMCILANADFDGLTKFHFIFGAVLYIIVCIYLNSAFKTFLKVVEQSIKQELNSHRKISAIFNSLQEGIVILQQEAQTAATKAPEIIYANEIARIIFSNLGGVENFEKASKTLVEDKLFHRYQRSAVFHQNQSDLDNSLSLHEILDMA